MDSIRNAMCSNAMCALMCSPLMVPDLWLTQYLDHISSIGDILYQQIGKSGQLSVWDMPIYMSKYNHQFKVSERQWSIGYIKWV